MPAKITTPIPDSGSPIVRPWWRQPWVIPSAGAVIMLSVAAMALALDPAATANPKPSPSASEQWPPLSPSRFDTIARPGLTNAWLWCKTMGMKHEWAAHTDITWGPDRMSLDLEQRDLAWIEGFYGHPVTTGVRTSVYDLTWIEGYLGHPLADGYYLWAGQTCILDALDAPPSIMDDMLATRTEDGIQTATWSDYQATWTNDGENGPDVVISYHHPENPDNADAS